MGVLFSLERGWKRKNPPRGARRVSVNALVVEALARIAGLWAQ